MKNKINILLIIIILLGIIIFFYFLIKNYKDQSDELYSKCYNLEEVASATVESSAAWRGLAVQDAKENKGVVIVEVEPASPADEAGLLADEVILEINKQPIKNISDYTRITRVLKGDALVKTSRGYFVVKEKID